jgi:pyruvate,orthophosphate dikinase
MGNMKGLLGGKGLGLNEMSNIGLSVPPGFTITTEVCSEFHKLGEKLPTSVWKDVLDNLSKLETKMNRRLGDPDTPLLVSIRSGAAISMPGMMDTVLNLGMNDDVVEGVAKSSGNPRFAYDSYRRFLHMYGEVVMGIDHHEFEKEIRSLKQQVGVQDDTGLSVSDLKVLCHAYKEVYKRNGKVFPTDPLEQLYYAITAVFNSWQSERAVKYREKENIIGLLGTAVNVQGFN